MLEQLNRRFVWAALGCFFAIAVTRQLRLFLLATFEPRSHVLLDSLPSLLGAVGVTFALQATTRGITRLNVLSATFIAAVLSLGYELAQSILPLSTWRTFDWNDIWATIAGLLIGGVTSWLIRGSAVAARGSARTTAAPSIASPEG